jgi:hypothetical protein
LKRRSGSASAVVRENAPFMVTSGATSAEELCLVVEGGLVDAVGSEVVAEDCLGAIAAGDGRELFSFQSGGLLMNAVGKQCVVLSGNDLAEGGRLVLESCDAAAKYADGRAKFSQQGAARTILRRRCACMSSCRFSRLALRAAVVSSANFAHRRKWPD